MVRHKTQHWHKPAKWAVRTNNWRKWVAGCQGHTLGTQGREAGVAMHSCRTKCHGTKSRKHGIAWAMKIKAGVAIA